MRSAGAGLFWIKVWDEEKHRSFTFLTNHFEFPATTVSAICKDRWQVELFFKDSLQFGQQVL